MDWDRLRVFHAVAEAGSFTHAGDTLNLSQSAVSRQISNLEKGLNCSLFHRHARGLILTEQGELLYRTVHNVFSQLNMVEAKLNDSKERPRGQLKITTNIGFGSIWLTPRIKEFISHFPDIEVSMLLTDDELDLSMREADVAIRLTPPTQPDLIRRQLTSMTFHAYATGEYIKRRGLPRSIDDLDNHDLVIFGTGDRSPVGSMNWLVEVGRPAGNPRIPVLAVNNIYAIYKAVSNGVGIGFLPNYMNQEADNLVPILPELKGPSLDVFFVYAEEQRHSKRITVFRDYLINRINQDR